ncbi:PAP2 superfamily protein [Roseateles sp. YR242]|nr:PAP2 superfamily protein [Roseateles sp. YR242]
MLLAPSPYLPFWHVLTRLGEAQALLPLAAMAMAGLWACKRQRLVVRRWVTGFVLVFGLTLLSKVAFMGWELGIASWDFTGFSGHAVCASAIFPLLAWLGLQAVRSARLRALGLCVALGLAALIAYSRLPVGAHSVSEALLGFDLGAAVALFALWEARPGTDGETSVRVLRRSAGLSVLMVALLFAAPWIAPPPRTHQWVTTLSLALSGREHPYTRHEMHRRAAGLVAWAQTSAAATPAH